MGFCAGIMLAASVVGLILPATEMAGSAGWWQVAIGVLGGALFLNLLDNITPHLHKLTGLDAETHANNAYAEIDWFKASVRAIRAFKVEDWSDFTQRIKK